MTKMIERATIAIHDAMDPYDELDMVAAGRYARAMLAEMREPTDEMVDSFATKVMALNGDVTIFTFNNARRLVRTGYYVMIDAALGGK